MITKQIDKNNKVFDTNEQNDKFFYHQFILKQYFLNCLRNDVNFYLMKYEFIKIQKITIFQIIEIQRVILIFVN